MSSKREDDLHRTVLIRDRKIKELQGELRQSKELIRLLTEKCDKYETVITDLYGNNVELQLWFDEMTKAVDKLKRGYKK